MDKGLDKGRVVTGRGDVDLSDSWRGDMDGYFFLLEEFLGDDNIGSSGGIIRKCFLFLWSNMNDSFIRGDTMGGLSLVSASFRHGGM